jgi:hypothetical protein
MNESFSEYVLYEPILRILTARRYTVRFEVECPGMDQPVRGDKKKLDLVAERDQVRFAMEVKWPKKQSLDAQNDFLKLEAFLGAEPLAQAFLCVFGRRSDIEALKISPARFREHGAALFAEFGKTKYGCRIFELHREA